MNKRKVTTSKEILHNLPYEAISVTLDSSELDEKIIKAGAVLAGKEKSVFEDRTQKVKEVKMEKFLAKTTSAASYLQMLI